MRGIYTAKRKNGSAIYIGFTPPGERQVRELVGLVPNGRGFASRFRDVERLAEGVLHKRKVAIAAGEFELAPRQKKRCPTFADYVRIVYVPAMRAGTNSAREKMKPRSVERETQRLTTGSLSWFSSHRLDDITRSVIERFVSQRQQEGVGEAGLNRDLARLRNLLNDAGDRDELRNVTLHKIAWTKLIQTEHPTSFRPMRNDEEPKLLAEFRDPIVRTLVEFLLHSGVRPDAGFGLQWKYVDLERAVVTIPRELDKVSKGYLVYLNSHIHTLLRGLYARRLEMHRQPECYVFAHRNGKRRRSK